MSENDVQHSGVNELNANYIRIFVPRLKYYMLMQHTLLTSRALLFSLAAVVWCSCESPIEVEDIFEPKVVVQSSYLPGQATRVYVSVSRPNDADEGTPYPPNAVVHLQQVGSQVSEQLAFVSATGTRQAHYLSQSTVIAGGETYRLKVSVPGFEPVVAHSYVPRASEITDVSVEEVDKRGIEDGSICTFRLDFSINLDPQIDETQYFYFEPQVNYSLWEQMGDDTVIIDTETYGVRVNPDRPAQFERFGNGFMFRSSDFEVIDNKLSLRFFLEAPSFTYTDGRVSGRFPHGVDMVLLTLSDDFYHFYTSINRQNQNNPLSSDYSFLTPIQLSGPRPVFIYNNVEGGLGSVAGFNFYTTQASL